MDTEKTICYVFSFVIICSTPKALVERCSFEDKNMGMLCVSREYRCLLFLELRLGFIYKLKLGNEIILRLAALRNLHSDRATSLFVAPHFVERAETYD
jgi:hypothetical protein